MCLSVALLCQSENSFFKFRFFAVNAQQLRRGYVHLWVEKSISIV